MSVTHPAGFTAAGVEAGLKTSGGKDMALVVNAGPTHDSATVFTANRCKANPILWSQEVVKDGVVRAVVLNSGGANCYTGAEGFQTTHAVAERVADGLEIGALDVVVCSTGLIGLSNPRENLLKGVDELVAALAADTGTDAAEAIMTTDHVRKEVVVEGNGWSIGGMAKGAGMLAPQLATMLVVLTTDAVVPAADLDKALRAATAAQLRPARLRRLHVHQRHRDDHGERRERGDPGRRRLRRGTQPGVHRSRDAAAQGRRGRGPRDHDHGPATPRPRTRRSRSAAASHAATCSRPPSSARTPTGAASWPASVRRTRSSTRPTSTSR